MKDWKTSYLLSEMIEKTDKETIARSTSKLASVIALRRDAVTYCNRVIELLQKEVQEISMPGVEEVVIIPDNDTSVVMTIKLYNGKGTNIVFRKNTDRLKPDILKVKYTDEQAENI